MADKKTMTIKRQKKSETPSDGFGSFKCDGKTYKLLMPGLNFPGIGVLTAADICATEEAQKHLVENKSHAIEEVIE